VNSKVAPNLKNRIINASLWTFGGHFVSQLIKLASNLIMTRILAPEAFGIIAVATLIIVGLSLLTDIGLQTNVIQSKETDDVDFMNSIWTIQILKGFFIWSIIVIFSFLLFLMVKFGYVSQGNVYANPALPWLISVIGLCMVISAFEPTWIMLATKNFQQRLIVKIEVISQIISVVVMILWATVDKSVWALVAGWLGGCLFKTIITRLLPGKHKNKWNWDRLHFEKVFHFGKWVFISTIIGYVVNNGDRVMLGGVVDERLMGLHSIAYLFIMAIMGVYGKFLSNVAYPALCEVNHHASERLALTFYKFRYMADAGLLIAAGALWVCGDSLVKFLYDARYYQTGGILQIMSIGLIAMRYNVSDQLFLCVGKPRLMTVGIVVKMTTLLIFFPVGFYQFGFYGALWGAVMASFSSIPFTLFYQKKLHVFSLKKELITLPLFIVGLLIGKLFAYTLAFF